ncbi:MAG TPA: tetratricopeptide repeat protein [Flavilitoribacter sp.]|nr:tetratricopeptide repeat protein [Flavilitoribacter sp.]HMQ88131.1 tetratricopeptide repeat protein [Flavilitoribacter sp.]
MDGHPLSISLLAYQAQAESKLDRLYRRWQSKRAELLKRGTGDHKDLNLAASINLSVESPEMQPEGLELLKALGQLPDGLGEEDLLALFPDTGDDAAANLLQLGLLLENAGRLRLLKPVREHTRVLLPPGEEQMDKLMAHFLRMAKKMGPRAGAEGGREAILELSVNWGNILNMLDIALAKDQPLDGIDAVIALADFQVFSGLRDTGQLDKSELIAKEFGDKNRQANCKRVLGNLAYRKSDIENAIIHLEHAMSIYEETDDLLGVAHCLWSFGDMAFRIQEYEKAHICFEKALSKYKRVDNLHGQANCVRSLGDLAKTELNYIKARDLFRTALSIYQRIGNLLGQANCIGSLGDLALLGPDNNRAREFFQKALPMFEKLGSLKGQANIISSLGNLAKKENDLVLAKQLYDKALSIYRKIQDAFSIGRTLFYLSQITKGKEQKAHREAARQTWEKAGYHRLIGENLTDD